MNSAIDSRFDSRFILFLLSGISLSFLLSIAALQIFVVILAVVYFFEKDKKVSLDLMGKVILLFAAARVLSVIFSAHIEASVHALYKEALFYFSFFALNYYLKTIDESKFNLLVKIFILSGTIVSIFGLFRFITNSVERAQTFSSGYMVFSLYLTIIFVFLLFNFRTISFLQKYDVTFKAFLSALILSGIITSLGRMNIAIALLFSAAAFILGKVQFKVLVFVFILTILLSGLSFISNSQAFRSRVEAPAALSDRDILYEGFFQLWDEKPITGFGPRTFKEIFPFREKFADKGIGSWHNDYIEIYIESGLIGLAALLGIFAALFYSIYRILKQLKLNVSVKNISTGVLASAIALMFAGLTSGFIKSPILSIVLAMLIAFNQRIWYRYKTDYSDSEIFSA